MSSVAITLSTKRWCAKLRVEGRQAGTMLAISLHAVGDELRDKLVPINRKYPIADLMAACRAYTGLSDARRITFEARRCLKQVNRQPGRRHRRW